MILAQIITGNLVFQESARIAIKVDYAKHDENVKKYGRGVNDSFSI